MIGQNLQYIVQETPRPAVMHEMMREQAEGLPGVGRAGSKRLRISRQFLDQGGRVAQAAARFSTRSDPSEY